MTKYFLQIADTVFRFVTDLQITPFYRGEKITQNMAGGINVDRIDGSKKIKITATISGANADEMETLENSLDTIHSAFKFYDGNTLMTKQMKLSALTKPPVIHLYNDKTQPYLYSKITITAEEI